MYLELNRDHIVQVNDMRIITDTSFDDFFGEDFVCTTKRLYINGEVVEVSYSDRDYAILREIFVELKDKMAKGFDLVSYPKIKEHAMLIVDAGKEEK